MIELEQMDWVRVRDQSKDLIRGALLTLSTSKLSLELAERELKKYPPMEEDDTN
jgi:hypothetical protein